MRTKCQVYGMISVDQIIFIDIDQNDINIDCESDEEKNKILFWRKILIILHELMHHKRTVYTC